MKYLFPLDANCFAESPSRHTYSYGEDFIALGLDIQRSPIANQSVLYECLDDGRTFEDLSLDRRMFWEGNGLGVWFSYSLQEVFAHVIASQSGGAAVGVGDVFSAEERERSAFWVLMIFWFFEKKRAHQSSVQGGLDFTVAFSFAFSFVSLSIFGFFSSLLSPLQRSSSPPFRLSSLS